MPSCHSSRTRGMHVARARLWTRLPQSPTPHRSANTHGMGIKQRRRRVIGDAMKEKTRPNRARDRLFVLTRAAKTGSDDRARAYVVHRKAAVENSLEKSTALQINREKKHRSRKAKEGHSQRAKRGHDWLPAAGQPPEPTGMSHTELRKRPAKESVAGHAPPPCVLFTRSRRRRGGGGNSRHRQRRR
jgi:hypothetical protein